MIVKNSHIILLLISLGAFLSSCSKWCIDFEDSKKQGNIILYAINQYYIDTHEYPNSLDLLIPKYLSEIPKVRMKNNLCSTHEEFEYLLYDVIPYEGCFMITFDHKQDGRKYEYDSRTNKIEWTKIATTNTDYIEEFITFNDIVFIANAIKNYYSDSLKYPNAITDIQPLYIDSFPFNIKAQYRPKEIAPEFSADLIEYRCYQPCDTFRGKFKLYFNVSFGQIEHFKNGGWIYNE